MVGFVVCRIAALSPPNLSDGRIVPASQLRKNNVGCCIVFHRQLPKAAIDFKVLAAITCTAPRILHDTSNQR
jgi:hypothetical protein